MAVEDPYARNVNRTSAILRKSKREGRTNGLDQGRARKIGTLPSTISILPHLLFLMGVCLYGASLLWPIGSLTPAWVSFPLALAGIALLILSLRSIWENPRASSARA